MRNLTNHLIAFLQNANPAIPVSIGSSEIPSVTPAILLFPNIQYGTQKSLRFQTPIARFAKYTIFALASDLAPENSLYSALEMLESIEAQLHTFPEYCNSQANNTNTLPSELSFSEAQIQFDGFYADIAAAYIDVLITFTTHSEQP